MASLSDTIISKDTGESLAVSMDFTDTLGTLTIASVNSIIAYYKNGIIASDLVISNISNTSTVVQFLVTSGTYNYIYTLVVLIITSDGQIFEGRGLLSVDGRN